LTNGIYNVIIIAEPQIKGVYNMSMYRCEKCQTFKDADFIGCFDNPEGEGLICEDCNYEEEN
jgi:hypothetical protein